MAWQRLVWADQSFERSARGGGDPGGAEGESTLSHLRVLKKYKNYVTGSAKTQHIDIFSIVSNALMKIFFSISPIQMAVLQSSIAH